MGKYRGNEALSRGDPGEEFTRKYIGRISDRTVLATGDKRPGMRAGEDVWILRLREEGILEMGPGETKSLFSNKGISFSSYGSPTMAIELWEQINPQNNAERTPGWFQKYLHPERFQGRAVKPGTLTYVYYSAGKYEKDPVPFLCIAFDDYPKLERRLIELGKQQLGIDFANEPLRPSSDEAYWEDRRMHSRRKSFVEANQWNVRFEDIKDLAQVVTIGSGPVISENESHADKQRNNYEYYRRLAKCHFDPETENRKMALVDEADRRNRMRYTQKLVEIQGDEEKQKKLQKDWEHLEKRLESSGFQPENDA